MYVKLGLLFRALRLSLFDAPFSLRRTAYVIVFLLLFTAFLALVWLGRMLDTLLFRGWRKQSVIAPVLIIATPRSGTTAMQRLLAMDEANFRPLLMYEMILGSVMWIRIVRALVAVAPPLRRCGDSIGRFFFGKWDDRHRIRLDLPEEDETIFVYTFASEAIYLLFPYVDRLPEAGFTDILPEREADAMMRFYKTTVQRLLYSSGGEKTLLAKSTSGLGRIKTLQRAFPDARFIHLIRHPAESIPSHVSVFYPTWAAHSPEIAKASPTSRAYAGLAASWYRHMLSEAPAIPERQYVRVMYTDFVADPEATVRRIYDRFGLALTPDYAARLSEEAGAFRRYRSTHRYTLAEYGLDDAWLEAEVGDVMRAYGFRPQPPPAA
jgi:omega-hydroxy-beta-dihydromenaquinone-9 sulfotransferase